MLTRRIISIIVLNVSGSNTKLSTFSRSQTIISRKSSFMFTKNVYLRTNKIFVTQIPLTWFASTFRHTPATLHHVRRAPSSETGSTQTRPPKRPPDTQTNVPSHRQEPAGSSPLVSDRWNGHHPLLHSNRTVETTGATTQRIRHPKRLHSSSRNNRQGSMVRSHGHSGLKRGPKIVAFFRYQDRRVQA